MLYNIRLKLSLWLFKMGKKIHPDLARLRKEIAEEQLRMGKLYLQVGIDENKTNS